MSTNKNENSKTESAERLRKLGAKLRQENKPSNSGSSSQFHAKSSDSYKMLARDESKENHDFGQDRPSLYDDDNMFERPSQNGHNDPFMDARHDLFNNPYEPEGKKRINSIVKLINARDPPNRYFDATVKLTDEDVWKRRSIYMSKADRSFEPEQVQNTRHTVANTQLSTPNLNREDSADEDFFDNVDEGIGEHDRVIPVIGVPK